MYQQKSKKGFTIIEVVLVLAIAGLIFLMVFIALPALQKSQRDTQRRNDLGAFTTALQQYMTNNRGAVPSGQTKWENFYNNYLNNSHGKADVYLDPDGEPYQIWWSDKTTLSTSTSQIEDQDSVSTFDSVNPSRFNFFGLINNAYAEESTTTTTTTTESATSCVEGATSMSACVKQNTSTAAAAALKWNDSNDGDQHKIYVFGYAECDGEDAKAVTNGKRRIAFRYKLEGAGTYCGTN